MYKEIEAKSALNHLNTTYLPYKWDLNIYRGCEHHCAYCYALYSHDYLDSEAQFFNTIFVKTNIAEKLEVKLSSRSWKKEIINIGGVTDSYQSSEAKYEIMKDVLKVMLKYEQPIIISTKSNLILRDFELIKRLSQKTYVNIAVSLITMDEKLQKVLEPMTATPLEKIEILKAYKKTHANIGCHTMPILPFITDSQMQLENLFKELSKVNPNYLLTGLLNLRGKTRTHFFSFIQKQFNDKFDEYQKLYKYKSPLYQDYKKDLYNRVNLLRKKYNLTNEFNKPIPEKINSYKQLTLF